MNPDITPRARVHSHKATPDLRVAAFGFVILAFAAGGWTYLFGEDATVWTRLAGVGMWVLAALLAWTFWWITRQEARGKSGIVVTDEEITVLGPKPVTITRDEVTSVHFTPALRHSFLGPLQLLFKPSLAVHAGNRTVRFSSGGDWEWAVDLVREWVRERPDLAADDRTREVMTAPDHTPLTEPGSGGRSGTLAWIGLGATVGIWLLGKLLS